MEDFCRFALNCKPLTQRAKQIRHDLSACIDSLDAAKLIANRDIPGDIGTGRIIANHMERSDLKSCFTAGCKRLTEALRVMEETAGTIDARISRKIGDLRYQAYTLEKDIVIFSDCAEKFSKVRLYVIITSDLPADVINLTWHCVLGGVDCIQLRSKTLSDKQLLALASEFTDICRQKGVLSIINDRVDIAIATGADGVHLGLDDLDVQQARKLELSPLIIGRTTHNVEQLRVACAELPTYISLGPVFATPTKPTVKAAGLEYVEKGVELLAETGVRHVAIGGINVNNIAEVLAAGAECISVCSAVTTASDSEKMCRVLKEKIAAFRGQ